MFGKPLDDSTVDRLLNGLMHPEDAPPSLARAAGLVRAAKAPAQASELVGREHAVATMSAAVRAVPSIQVSKGITRLGRKAIGRKTMIGKISAKLLSAKLAAGVAAAVVAGGGAAAATGSLPSSIQAPLSSALSHVGISIPKPSSSSGSSTTQSSSTTTTSTSTSTSMSGSNSTSTSSTGSTGTSHNSKAVGPTASGASAYGLCHAYAATKGNTSANDIALRNLSDAAQKAGVSITKFCSVVTPGSGSRPSGTGKPSGVGGGSSSAGAGASAGGSGSSHVSGTRSVTTSIGASGHGASSVSAGAGGSIR